MRALCRVHDARGPWAWGIGITLMNAPDGAARIASRQPSSSPAERSGRMQVCRPTSLGRRMQALSAQVDELGQSAAKMVVEFSPA